MNRNEALDALFEAFKRYYNITTEGDNLAPFVASAVFKTHDEQYFLIKSAKITEYESQEYVFFASEDELDLDKLLKYDEIAWERGLKDVNPSTLHKSTDVTLVIVADTITPEAQKKIKKLKKVKSYFHGIHGYSHYRLIALELSTSKIVYNRLGESLKKLISNITKNS